MVFPAPIVSMLITAFILSNDVCFFRYFAVFVLRCVLFSVSFCLLFSTYMYAPCLFHSSASKEINLMVCLNFFLDSFSASLRRAKVPEALSFAPGEPGVES